MYSSGDAEMKCARGEPDEVGEEGKPSGRQIREPGGC